MAVNTEEVQTTAAVPLPPKFLDGTLLAKMASGGAAALKDKADEVNQLNVFPVPDGDTGINMFMTIASGVAALERSASDSLTEAMTTFAHGMLLGARGNSGVILSQFFSGMAKGLAGRDKADCQTLAHALEIAVKQAYHAVLTPTEGTILTVAREAVEYAVSRLNDESTIPSLFADLTTEMYASLQRTPDCLAVLKEAGVIDSGGAGLLYIMQGFNRVLNGEEIFLKPIDGNSPAKAAPNTASFNSESEIHTMTPERVLAFCHDFGEFITLKIENMSLQHNETLINKAELPSVPPQPRKRFGSVAVCSGAGIEATFREFGVDCIVEGGQTSNPSTGDFLRAFDKVTAEHIFVFPNNGNIYLAAKQAAAIYTKADVRVIESNNLGSGYVGITAIDPDAPDANTVEKAIVSAMQRGTTGNVSTAIRDANLSGVQITLGDYIGFIGKETVVSDPDVVTAVCALIDRLFSDKRKSMLTIFCGLDSKESDNESIRAALRKTHPRLEVYFSDGGQDIYPYILIAE